MKKSLLFFVLFSLVLATEAPTFAQPITSLDNLKMETQMQFRSQSGKLYWVWQYKGTCKKGATSTTSDIDDNDKACNGSDFDGRARFAVKVSLADVAEEAVTNYPRFLRTLPTDEEMCTDLPEDARTADEMHNVRVTGLWLYAFKRQADEDYHLMVGTSRHYETALAHGFYNVEISGTPPRNHVNFDQVKEARDQFEGFFGITTCAAVCRNYVDLYQNPIKIEVTGSMFYDIDHCHRFTHPADYPINTAWEIHPIKNIRFIEN